MHIKLLLILAMMFARHCDMVRVSPDAVIFYWSDVPRTPDGAKCGGYMKMPNKQYAAFWQVTGSGNGSQMFNDENSALRFVSAHCPLK